MAHSEAPSSTKQGPRIGFAAAFGLGIVPVALLLVVHGRALEPSVGERSDVGAERQAASAPVVAQSGSKSGAPSSPSAPRAAAEVPLERPATEAEYFRRLEELRKSAPEDALAWLGHGDEWYGAEGEQAEARTAMRVTVLVDLGRMSEARAVTRRFIVEHPESPYRRLVQGMTGIHPRPGPPASVAARQQ